MKRFSMTLTGIVCLQLAGCCFHCHCNDGHATYFTSGPDADFQCEVICQGHEGVDSLDGGFPGPCRTAQPTSSPVADPAFGEN